MESFIPEHRRKKAANHQAELRSLEFALLCEELGQPQQQFHSIHVAGSKGKGQTASYIAHGLAALNLRVGLFSSPHLHSYSERIQVLQQKRPSLVEEGGLRREVETLDISTILEQEGRKLRQDFSYFHWVSAGFREQDEGPEKVYLQPNFFAVLTLLAFRSFAAASCDWVVLETGIGGRLCPTNVVTPELSVITPIELEHTDILGERLELVAAEKAAIIKAGRPCVSARQYPEVEAVLRAHAAQKESPLYFLPQCLKSFHTEEISVPYPVNSVNGQLWQTFLRPRRLCFEIVLEEKARHSELFLRAYSSTQADNLALALLGLQVWEEGRGGPQFLGGQGCYLNGCYLNGLRVHAEEEGREAPAKAHWDALLRGLESSRVAGRFSLYCLDGVLLLVDGAHTPVSCARLMEDMQGYLDDWQRIFPSSGKKLKLSLLFAAVQGKNFTEMARILAPKFDEILLTRAGTFKENNLAALEQAFSLSLRGEGTILARIEEPAQALEKLLENSPDLLVICGSFYLLGELLPLLNRYDQPYGF
ncbi:MAG: hypothetical protein AAF975_02570 [Spirochaetota bacterium]